MDGGGGSEGDNDTRGDGGREGSGGEGEPKGLPVALGPARHGRPPNPCSVHLASPLKTKYCTNVFFIPMSFFNIFLVIHV